MKIKTVNIAEKLNKPQTEIISNIIHDVLVDLGYGDEQLDFYAWDLEVDIEIAEIGSNTNDQTI